jgi:polyisoprenoid-binding protein YceI
MKPVARNSFIAILLIFTFQTVVSQQVYLTRTGAASFVSNAPLEIIKAESKELQGAIDPVAKTFAFTIDNKSFKGFNNALQQEHFYENYMEAQQFPTSTFKGKIIEDIDLNSTNEQVVRAKGILEIHGIKQERIIKGTVRIQGQKIELRADFTVLLADHQIKIPKVVYQKIAEEISVSINALLTRETN